MARRRRVSTRRRYSRRIYGAVRRRVRRPKTISIAVAGGLAAGLFQGHAGGSVAGDAIKFIQSGNPEDAVNAGKQVVINYTGLNLWEGGFNFMEARGLQGIIVGALVHKLMGMLGVNRILARQSSPLNKISI